MQVLMRKVGGVELEKPERALSQTAKPVCLIQTSDKNSG
jgi:hypothetical protein